MRIIIELEQHELQVAKELIDSLRSITDQLQVRTAKTTVQESAAASRAPTPTPAQQPPPLPPPTQNQTMPAYVQPALAVFQNMAVQPPAAPTMPPATAPSPQESGRGTVFSTVLQNFSDGSQLDSVVSNLSMSLSNRQDTSSAMSELVDAFEGLLTYDPANPGASLDTERVERYFMLLNHKLPDHFDAELRKGVLQRVVRQLTKQREVACDRTEVWPAAVGFGCLVALECVKITGALTMIERQLSKPTTVAAAVTMLGNVLSMCGQLVCTAPAEQVKVWQVVDNSKDLKNPCFAADRAFFASWRQAVGVTGEPPVGPKYQPLGPPPAPAASATAYSPAGQDAGGAGASGGAAGGRWSINQVAMIQMGSPGAAIAWDAPSGTALVGAMDGSLGAWDTYSGHEKTRLPSAAGGMQVSFMSTGQRGQVLLAANPAPNMPNATPYLALHDTINPGLPCRAACSRRSNSMITSVLLLSQETDMAVSCESWPSGSTANGGGTNGGMAYPVCLWDSARLAETGQAQELAPLHTWMDGHSSVVCCSAASQYQPSTFFTGAADGVVRVWDTRMRSPAGSLQGTNSAPAAAHAAGGGVTVMECQGHVLVTGGSDAMVCIWDVRALGQPSVNALIVASPGVPVYKLAYRDSPSPSMAAIALGSGLYLLDWTNNSSTMSPCPGYHDVGLMPGLVQHDIAWASSGMGGATPTLLSVSTQPMMSVFAVRNL